MKTIATHIATLAFDNHQVTLKGDGIEVLVTYKDRKDFDKISKGDAVEVVIGKEKKSITEKATAEKAPAKPRAKKVTTPETPAV